MTDEVSRYLNKADHVPESSEFEEGKLKHGY